MEIVLPERRPIPFAPFDHSFPSFCRTTTHEVTTAYTDPRRTTWKRSFRLSAIKSELFSSVTTFLRVNFGVAIVYLSLFLFFVVPGVDPRFATDVNAHVTIQYRVSDGSTLFYMRMRVRSRQVEEFCPSGRTVLDSIRSNLLGQLHDDIRPSTIHSVAVKLNRRET